MADCGKSCSVGYVENVPDKGDKTEDSHMGETDPLLRRLCGTVENLPVCAVGYVENVRETKSKTDDSLAR